MICLKGLMVSVPWDLGEHSAQERVIPPTCRHWAWPSSTRPMSPLLRGENCVAFAHEDWGLWTPCWHHRPFPFTVLTWKSFFICTVWFGLVFSDRKVHPSGCFCCNVSFSFKLVECLFSGSRSHFLKIWISEIKTISVVTLGRFKKHSPRNIKVVLVFLKLVVVGVVTWLKSLLGSKSLPIVSDCPWSTAVVEAPSFVSGMGIWNPRS